MSAVPGDIVRAQVDEWGYRSVQLPCGIQALLVHDETADKAAAAMDVQVGSMSDPVELPGLAHFTEHMLFYASAKYPKEDEYSKWVSDHGGHTNAWTSAENTNYQFTVNAEHLESTLDRFAQFFIAPLISPDGIARERQAVDSEHSKNVNSDGWRQQQLWKEVASPDHAYSRFFTGNMETLGTAPEAAGIDVHAALLDFYAQQYSANRMKLCVLGKESLDDLEALVKRLFADVPNKGLPVNAPHAGEPYPPAALGKLIKALPAKEGHTVQLRWVIPPLEHVWRESPDGFLGHMIGHEGRGSLFALLKEKGWAKSLSAGGYAALRGFSVATVSITLTDAGNAAVADVLQHMFEYIALLRAPTGVTAALFEDAAALKRLAFDFREKPNAFSYVSDLANALHTFPVEHVLEVLHHVPQAFDEATIRRYLDHLTPEACIAMWVSHAHSPDSMRTERWYAQKYSCEALPQEWLRAWQAPGENDALHVPAPNPFTPSNLALLPTENNPTAPTAPSRIVHDALVSMHYKTHLEFKAPKACLRLRFILPACAASLEAQLCTHLFTHLIADDLNETAYEAELAGLSWSMEASLGTALPGLTVKVSGYSDKLPALLDVMLARARAFTVREARFAVVAEKFALHYRNWDRAQPYAWCSHLSEQVLQTDTHSLDDSLALLPRITAATVQRFIDGPAFSRGRVEGLLIGNVDASAARAVADAARAVLAARGSLPLLPSELDRFRLVRLPRGAVVEVTMMGRNPDDANSAHTSVFQGPAQADSRAHALSELVGQIVQRPAFHQLRTVEQIGYLVWTYESVRSEVPHVVFLLQSTALSAAEIQARVAAFLRQWRRSFEEELSDESFAKHVDELAKSKLEKPRGLRTLADRWFFEILIARFDFERPASEVAALRQLTRQELVDYVDSCLLSLRSAGRLCVNVRGTAELSRERGSAAAEGGTAVGSAGVQGKRGGGKGEVASLVAPAGSGACAVNGVAKDNGSVCGAAKACPVGDDESELVGGAGQKVVVVKPSEVALFRMRQGTWPLTRNTFS